MSEIRKITKKYYLRQIVACWLVFYMLFCFGIPLRTAKAEVVMTSNPEGAITVSPLNGGTVQNMTAIDGSIGNFSDFDIASGHTVNCQQFDSTGLVLDPTSQALFKVFGNGTEIYGTFNANGCIWLIDPAGILVGNSGVINVNQFVASTLSITNQDFLDGKYDFSGDSGAIINEGTIIAQGVGGIDSMVALIGQKVLNTGTISAPGGVVVMAAGDRVWLSEPGSKIIVEMSSATGDIDGVGKVTNEGSVEAPDGQIVLAAGDIYSIPLHPQLQIGEIENRVYDYTDDDDKAIIDLQPVRVETGTGSVEQLSSIQANGANGSVILTAGDDIVLEDGSSTTSVGGEVITYAYDFGSREATTYFNAGATIQVGDGTALIGGNHILFAGTADILTGGDLRIDPVTLTIADTMPDTGPELDTLYEEEHVEFYSLAGVNLDLAADDMITVEYMADSDVVGEITGGSGDIYFRNVFDNGGIYFEQEDEAGHTGPRTTIHTTAFYESDDNYRDGGGIYMDSGSGGIVAGDLFTDTIQSDKMSQPGEILLRSNNDGDIEVGTMQAIGADSTQVSAISSGNLIVHGDADSINKQVDNELQTVSKAILCLIADGDVILNGTNYEVYSHGKYETTADIRISAGGNVYIASADNPATITAEAKTSEQKDVTKSTALIIIHAGRTLYDDNGNPAPSPEGEIIINGVTYTPGTSYLPKGKISAKAWPDLQQGVDSSDTPDLTDGTKTVWEDTADPAENFFVRIEINSHEAVPADLGPCADCPTPPGLPPVPHIFWILDDSATVSWSDIDVPIDVLANDDNGGPLDGFVLTHTHTGGTLVPITDGLGNIIGFEYTPPPDAVFTWDGISAYAVFTDTFTYKAKDAEGNISINTATVTISVTNFLPVLEDASDSIHMATASNPTSADFDVSTLVTDSDGTPGVLTYGIMEGQIPVADGSIATDSGLIPDTLTISGDTVTYSPLEGYVSPTDSPTTFGYTVTDSSIVDTQQNPVEQSGDLEVTVTNKLPTGDSWLGTTEMDTSITDRALVVDGFADVPDIGGEIDTVSVKIDNYSGTEYISGPLGTYGGELEYDGDYTYTPDTDLPGYIGDGQDDFTDVGYDVDVNPDEKFTVQLWDGQRTYYENGSSQVLTTDYGTGTISVDITNELPSGNSWLGTTHMETPIVDGSLQTDNFTDADGHTIKDVVVIGPSSDDYDKSFGGDLAYDDATDTYDYDPTAMGLPGYVGDDVDNFDDAGYVISNNADDRFDVQLWDGQQTYEFNKETGEIISTTKVYGSGTVSVDITNTLPTASGDLGTTPQNTQLTVIQTGTSSPVEVSDIEPDSLSIVQAMIPDHYTGSAGGTLEFNGSEWIYTPASGYIGPEEFTINVSDGQNNYEFVYVDENWLAIPTPEYGQGIVSATVQEIPPPPVLPAIPVPVVRAPEVEGCPAVIAAAAGEIGIPQQTIQLWIGNSVASGIDIQPCDVCSRLVSIAGILRDETGARLAALAEVINIIAPADVPFTPELGAQIAAAFEERLDEDVRYATAQEYIDAFVAYVLILQEELPGIVPDPIVFTMDKYGGGIMEQENANIGAFVGMQLEAAGGL